MPLQETRIINGFPSVVECAFVGKDGTRFYRYTGSEAAAIIAGKNPEHGSGLRGQRIDGFSNEEAALNVTELI